MSAQPLDGLRVVEVTAFVAAPLGGMGISIPSIVQGQTVVQDEGGGGKGGLGSALGGAAQMGGMMYAASSRDFKENKRPAEDVLE